MTVKSITEITDHAGVALSRLPQQYKDAIKKYPAFWQPGLASGWEGLLQSFISPAQNFETIANEMLNERGLLTGEGVNLDRIGQIVGQSRDGLDDDAYRGTITAQIAENNSDGTAANLLAIADLLLGPELRDLSIREFYPAKARIEYFVENQYTIDGTNDFVQVEADFGVSGPVDITLLSGDYFPTELLTLFEDAFLVALGSPIQVSWDAGARTFTFHLDDVATANAGIIWGSAGDLYGFPPPVSISSTTTGAAISGLNYNSEAVLNALESAKLAGVDISIELIVLGNYFGFSNDTEALGFGALDGGVLIGGGNYSTLIP